MPLVNLTTEVQYLKGIGPRLAEGLKKAGLNTTHDLLYRFPRRYEDRSKIPPIGTAVVGEWTTVKGRLKKIESRPLKGGKVLLRAILGDGSGTICLTWFNQPWIKTQLEKASGSDIFAYGQVKLGNNTLELGSPEWEAIGEDDDPNDFGRIVPVYGLTEGLSQRTIRRAVRAAVANCLEQVQDPLPLAFRKKHQLPEVRWALRQMHEPESEELRLEARERFVFEEFFYLQLGLAMKRAETHHEIGIAFPISSLLSENAPTPETDPFESEGSTLFAKETKAGWGAESLPNQIKRLLPFELTGAQKRVLDEIWRDMASPTP